MKMQNNQWKVGYYLIPDSEELLDKKLFKNQKNIKIVQEAMFASTNERFGTSYKSRIDDP